MFRKTGILVVCLVLVCSAAGSVWAISNAGVLFLRIAAGARAAGMGEAFVAVADDATATHWNPAGLGQYPMHSNWLDYAPPKGKTIIQAALARTVTLGEGQAAYDVWAISDDGRLMRFSGGKWDTEVPLPEGVTEVHRVYGAEQDLWLATDKGLFRFSMLDWKPVVPPTENGWEGEAINDIHVTAGPRLWLATDDGVKCYDGLQWTTYGVEAGLPSPKVNKVYFVNSQLGWAATAAGLVRFDGKRFDDAEQVNALIGDPLPKVVGKFIGTEDSVRIARATEEVRRLNDLQSDQLAPGAVVRIPYRLAFESDITCLATDVNGRLWVGTAQGLKVFDQKRWRSFGYRAYTIDQPTTAAALAEAYLGNRATPKRVEAFAEWIARYNNLSPQDTITAGRTVYLYNNSTGGPIRCLSTHDQSVYVGSKYGFLVYEEGQWRRMYHAGIDHSDAVGIAQGGRDLWFFAPDRMVTYARSHAEVTFMYVNWLPELASDINYGYLSIVSHKEGVGVIGISATGLFYGEVARTDPTGPQILGSFNPFDFCLGVSYGTRLTPSLAAGLTGKVIYSRLSEQGAGRERGSGTATAFALDAGLLYRTPLSRLTLGAALTNFGPDITYIDADQSDPLPRNLAAGFSYKLFDSPYNRLLITGEANKDLTSWGGSSQLKQIVYNAGFEYWYARLVALRAGYIYDQDGDIRTPTIGAGIFWRSLGIDLGYVPSVREDQVMANILRASLTFRF